jgi:hypothetical protein
MANGEVVATKQVKQKVLGATAGSGAGAFIGVLRTSCSPTPLAVIMRHMDLLCTSSERARAGDPTCWIGVRQLVVRRVGVDLPRWRLVGRSRPSATVRNNVPSGQLVGR